jgi:hypothetical protein
MDSLVGFVDDGLCSRHTSGTAAARTPLIATELVHNVDLELLTTIIQIAQLTARGWRNSF